MSRVLILTICLMSLGCQKSSPPVCDFTSVALGQVTLTAYRSVPGQTDSSPWSTSIGERVTIRGCAVSQDLLADNGGPLHYGDLIYIEQVGFRFVNDSMNKKIKRGVDLWVPTIESEKKVFKKFQNGLVTIKLIIPKGESK